MEISASGLPFDDIRRLAATAPAGDEAVAEALADRLADLATSPARLGRLGDLALWLARWQGRAEPRVLRPLIAVFACAHGVADMAEGEPGPAARRAMDLTAAGGGAAGQAAQAAGAGLKVFDLAVDQPTPDIRSAPALDEKACAATMAFGMECLAEGPDLLGLGEASGGALTAASALCTALLGGEDGAWIAAEADRQAAEAAAQAHGGGDPLTLLAHLGGRDCAAMAGAILAARHQNTPVLLDGFVSLAAAAVLHALEPGVLDHCAAATSAEDPAQARLIAHLGMRPLLDLRMSARDGAGAAAAIPVLQAAVACALGMARRGQVA